MTLVIDASVVIKWLFADPEREDYTELATNLIFDSLYHAVALEHNAILVTADDRYHRKAKELPGIMHLKDWALPE